MGIAETQTQPGQEPAQGGTAGTRGHSSDTGAQQGLPRCLQEGEFVPQTTGLHQTSPENG